jgi:hypothetical protein
MKTASGGEAAARGALLQASERFAVNFIKLINFYLFN